GREHWLETAPCRVIIKVGQQALATFMASMALAWMLSIALDQVSGEGTTYMGKYRPAREPLAVAAANIFGLAAIIGVAYMVDWYKREPWRRVGQAPAQSVSGSRAAAQPAAAAPESAALAVAPGARAYR
ncbi:MAG: OpgC domain-containing protein, partial [Geminicoccaceae bacterium]